MCVVFKVKTGSQVNILLIDVLNKTNTDLSLKNV